MKLHFCPECAAPLAKLTSTRYRCERGHSYFNNPRAACSVVFMNAAGELLYAKRAREPLAGKYDFPGGFLDYGEDAYQAAQREMLEEAGLHVAAADLQLIDTSANHYQENITTCDFVFLCSTWQGSPEPADDVAALEWHPIAFLRSPRFAWPYPHLYNKLLPYAAGRT